MIPAGMWLAFDFSIVIMIFASVLGFSIPGRSIWTVVIVQVIVAIVLMLTLPALSGIFGGC